MSTPRSASPPIAPEEAATAAFASAVQYYLTLRPRQLPSRYLYDALGSALFEAICHLPWYGITRAESRLLDAYAADVFRLVAPVRRVVELGPGSGDKLRRFLDVGRERPRLDIHVVDVSPSALAASNRAVADLENVNVVAHQSDYETGLADALEPAIVGHTVVLFLGSNIGNFDPPGAAAFLRSIRGRLRTGDAVLLGADLVKPERDLRLAYDDPLGVTAAFNRNLLVRINRELAATFDVEAFSHRAVWNAGQSRIEMHLVADSAQRARIPRAGVEISFERGETIWTESSYKYRPAQLRKMIEAAGFASTAQWVDAADPFALTLAIAV